MFKRFLPFLMILVLLEISNIVVRRLVGIDHLTGWRFWIYDLPAFWGGMAAGYFIFKK